jgi:hypothetical protein
VGNAHFGKEGVGTRSGDVYDGNGRFSCGPNLLDYRPEVIDTTYLSEETSKRLLTQDENVVSLFAPYAIPCSLLGDRG